MEINYVQHKDGTRLFSFYRHDFKEYGEGNDKIMIDGGFDYTRYSGELKRDQISNLIKDIRTQFKWGSNYDKNMNRLPKTVYRLLKDLETSHILEILKLHHFNIIRHIFLEELIYRDNELRDKKISR